MLVHFITAKVLGCTVNMPVGGCYIPHIVSCNHDFYTIERCPRNPLSYHWVALQVHTTLGGHNLIPLNLTSTFLGGTAHTKAPETAE